AGVRLGQHDIYLNVAGGLKVNEPAADLAAAAALISSVTGQSLPTGSVFFGEIGLSGQIRPVAHSVPRLKEAAKLGFTRALVPALAQETQDNNPPRNRAPRSDRDPPTDTAAEIRSDVCIDVASLAAAIAAPSRRQAGRGP
ncbi:MAG: hypothetical protein EPN75_06380, partial [Beijerinckiaceae bacterium]